MRNIPPMKEPVSKRLSFFVCGLGGGGAIVVGATGEEDGAICDDVIIGDGEMVELMIDDVIFIADGVMFIADDKVALIEMVGDGAVVFMNVVLVVTLYMIDGVGETLSVELEELITAVDEAK